MCESVDVQERSKAKVWRPLPSDLSDEEWELIEDLVPTYSGNGAIGRPAKWHKRVIVNAIMYITSTGCQWRGLPDSYPPWRTVYDYHKQWSNDGTWENIGDRLRERARVAEGRDPDPSGSAIDARSVQGASTVGASTRGFDAAKKVSGRKVFGLVDTMGFLVAVTVMAANVSDNVGGMATVDLTKDKRKRLKIIWHDGGFKKTFVQHCAKINITAENVPRTSKKGFEVLPHRWVVERTWAWLVNYRRLRIDYERDPIITTGFIWAAQTRILLRRLTPPPQKPTARTK